MSTIDIIILAVCGAAIVWGLIRGLITQLASLGGLVLGIIACRLFGAQTAPVMMQLLPGTFHSEQAARIAGSVLLFILVYLTVGLIASLARKLTRALMLGWLDHLLGALAALLKWLVALSIVLNLWKIVAPGSSLLHGSRLMDGELLPAILNLAPRLFGIAMSGIDSALS